MKAALGQIVAEPRITIKAIILPSGKKAARIGTPARAYAEQIN